MRDLFPIIKGFQLSGNVEHITRFGNGHIHETYLVTHVNNLHLNRSILQKINTSIFKEPSTVMHNIQVVTDHIRKRLQHEQQSNINQQCLSIIPTHIDTSYLKDTHDNYWRLYAYVDGVSYDVLQTEKQAFAAAKAFGNFQKQLLDLDSAELFYTIPHFHDTPEYLLALYKIVALDPCNRAKHAKHEIKCIEQHINCCFAMQKLHQAGELPLRITHNDTKLNNILFDAQTSTALCIIDLDTVMPGLIHCDFGDMLRTYTSPVPEDEPDLEKIQMRMHIYQAITRGYMHSMGNLLTKKEIELLPFSGKVLALESAIRFLTDYLSGDVYYKITCPEHNLTRCRAQLALLNSMVQQFDAMQAFIQKILEGDELACET